MRPKRQFDSKQYFCLFVCLFVLNSSKIINWIRNRPTAIRVVLWSGYAISLIWGEKRCVSAWFQICLILMFCIVGKWNSMFPKFCDIKYLWTIFMTGPRQSFSERTYFWRNTTLDATVWGKIWNALILVNNNVFVLQATQSINSPNLEASRLQVHFLQQVKLHVFGEDVFWRNTDF